MEVELASKKMELPSSQPEICRRTSTSLMDFLGDVVKRSDPESNPFFKNWFPLWLTGDDLFPRRRGVNFEDGLK